MAAVSIWSVASCMAAPAHIRDSLSYALNGAQPDTAKVRLLIKLSALWRDTAVLPALNYALDAKRLADQADWTEGRFWAGYAVGQCYDAVEQWDKALAVYNSLKPLAEASGDAYIRMRMDARLSESYRLVKKADSSFYYRMEALRRANAIHDTVSEANLLIYLGGDCAERKDYRQAIYYWRAAAAAAHGSSHINHEAMPLNNIAEAYLTMGEADSAYPVLQQGLALMRRTPVQYTAAHLLNNLGIYFRMSGRNDSALAALRRAQAIARQPGGSREALEAGLRELYTLYEAIGRSSNALTAYRQYIAVRDSNQREARIAEDARAVLRYDYQLQASANEAERGRLRERSRQQRITIIAAEAGLLAFGLLAAFLYYAFRQNKRKMRIIAAQAGLVQSQKESIQAALADKDILIKEIHHRVKNNLQVISALLAMQASRSADAQVKAALEDSQNRVLSIAFLHQNLYQHDDLTGVEMRRFVADLSGHILGVAEAAEKRIKVTQNIEPLTLDIDTAVPLGLILNELFTNSCKHAFKGQNEGAILICLASTGQRTL